MIAQPETFNSLSTTTTSENGYARHFSEASFWRKMRRFARVAGREVIEKALFLYYALQSPDMPSWARTVVLGALGYFVLPADAIPDLLPGIGFTDDLGALAAAVAVVLSHITPQVRRQARRKLRQWFSDADSNHQA
mgnify:CR=1 FL=1